MKKKLSKVLPVLLAGILQIAPIVKTALMEVQAWSPVSWAFILRIGVGTVGMFGFHAISSASSIAISPVNATNGTPYVGTITYSGSHAGSVSSMMFSNHCLTTSFPFLAGMNIVYSGANKATVSGTPTNSGTFPFTLKIFDGICGGLSDTRSTTLVIGTGTGGATAPSMVAAPQSITAQVGADVLFSAGASGNPVPRYYWYIGIPSPSTLVSTNSSFAFPNVQLTNSGLYTVTASNASGQVSATAYLSVCNTAGSNVLSFNYTNYFTVSNPLVMTSFITNVPSGSNAYKWQYNYFDVTSFSTNGNNFSLTSNQVTAAKSGIYSVVFNGNVGTNNIVPQQAYDSYWAFGTTPVINASPQTTNANAGTNVTLSVSTTVQQNPYGTNLNLGFLWYLNNSLVSTQVSPGTNQTATLTLTNVSANNSGSYTVVVTNYWGSTTSSPAILTVNTPPAISSQPVARAAVTGQTVTFNVTATGTGLNYQWSKGVSPLSNGGIYSGVTSSILTLTGVQPSNAGNYAVAITNNYGSVISSNAALTVTSPPFVSLTANSGSLQLSGTGSTGLTYVVQSSTGLATPTIWTPIVTNVVPPSGVLSFTNAVSNSSQYFRLLFP